ncbi:MAG: metal-sulfur cluster assembly factor [Chloroflexi bacterium]|nr:metal-sulfur cluster assembly factor [Chloroflexota bacterium]
MWSLPQARKRPWSFSPPLLNKVYQNEHLIPYGGTAFLAVPRIDHTGHRVIISSESERRGTCVTDKTCTKEDVLNALKDVYDPEIPIVNIVDLGLIYDVQIDDGNVHVKMTLTAVGCPMHTQISAMAQERICAVEGVKEADVEVVWDPPWTPEKISPEGMKALGWT